ncbi:MAG: FixH family protein [Chitinophagaceae bacterium]|nr:FixH family protein [Chitinophagaceae bacterium]MCB9047427.1 FixH family protein [Chitinophagales bacterium]
MSTMKLGWGGRIAVLYGGFVVLIAILVTGSMRQEIDLVADDYYQQELAYQDVLDAGKNQALLSAPVSIHADETSVTFEFPGEFNNKTINGTIQFYSAKNSAWDKNVPIENAQAVVNVERSVLQNTQYKIKLNWDADGKKYYQESDINLF